MDITEVLTKGGPEAIIAALFVYVLTLLVKNNKEQQEAHRAEIKDMRNEHIQQVTSITDKFTTQIENLSSEFTSGLSSMKDGLNHIADEVRDLKVRIDITTQISQ